MKKPRDETQILEDLSNLTGSPGYAHVIAHISHRDNLIKIKGKLKPSDMDRLFSRERLIRTELTTLIGLMAKKPLNLSLQQTDVLEGYVKRTDTLMHELHEAMSYPMFAAIFEAVKAGAAPPDPGADRGCESPSFTAPSPPMHSSTGIFCLRSMAPMTNGCSRTKGSHLVRRGPSQKRCVL